MEEQNTKQAQMAYATLQNCMKQRDWNYQANEQELSIKFTITGDGLDINHNVRVDAQKQGVTVFCPLQFSLPEDAISGGALILCAINDRFSCGNFDLDIETGRICFRVAMTFRDSVIGEEAYGYIIDCATCMVDKYSDELFRYAKGKITWEKFIEEYTD